MIEFKILFFGDIANISSNSQKIAELINEYCPNSRFIDWSGYTKPNQRRFFRRLDGYAFTQSNLSKVSKLLISEINDFKPNVIWLEKPLLVTAELIQEIKKLHPNAFFISRQDDNPFGGRKNELPFWRHFVKAIPLYDLHFVKRESDWLSFSRLGASKIANFWVGYDSKQYFVDPSQKIEKKYDFSFIGTNMDSRSSFLSDLQSELGTNNFLIAGANWKRSLLRYRFPHQVITSPLSDEDSRQVFNQSHASLGLFSTSNHDEFSSRIFLIAASGSVIVAPRSRMHEHFFEDTKEAFYFDNLAECASIIKTLIANPEISHEVGANAALRAKKDRYSLSDAVIEALEKINTMLG